MNQVTEKLSLKLYYEMLGIRMVEEAIGERYSQQQMRCPVHLSIGQEAIPVGVLHHVSKTDYLISNHRAHAHYLAKGGSLKKMLAEIYGKSTGCSSGKGGSMHLIDLEQGIVGTTPIVGGSLPVGVGVAFAEQLKKKTNLTVIFFGEGATEEGVWAECLNFASLRSLSLLFVCENNLYSVYSPMSVRQSPKRDREAIAKAHGIETFTGSGNDLEQVYQVAGKAVEYIKEKAAPCYVEFSTYRYREHCGPFVDPKGYRPEAEEKFWYQQCPLKLYTEKLLKNNSLTEDQLNRFRQEIKLEIEEAFQFAESSPFPIFNPNESATVYA